MSKRKEATPSWGRSWDGNSCLMGGIQIKVHQSEVVCFHTWGKELCIDPEQVSWARKQKILFSNLPFIPVKNTEYYLCTRQWQTMPSNGNRRRDSELTKHTHIQKAVTISTSQSLDVLLVLTFPTSTQLVHVHPVLVSTRVRLCTACPHLQAPGTLK